MMVIKGKKIKETTQYFSIPNSFKTIFSTGSSGREIAKEVKKTINTNNATSKKGVNFTSAKIGSFYDFKRFFGVKFPESLSKDAKKENSKGFGFVEMPSEEEAKKAKDALNDTDFDGRPLKIDEARPPRKPIKSDKGDK